MSYRPTTNCLVTTVVIAAISLFGGCEFPLSRLEEADRTVNVSHVEGTVITVETANGSVSVKQSDREDVEVVAHLRALTRERLEAAQIVAERTEDGGLSVHVDWPDGKRQGREGCSFEVLVPDAEGVVLRSSNGGLHVEGLGGEADLHTSNGAIEVRNHSGSVAAATSNGRIVASAVEGTLDLESSNGKIRVIDATSEVKAHTSNGAMEIAMAPEAAGPIEAQTSNGSVTVEVGPAFEGGFTLTTSNGSVNVDEVAGCRLVSSAKKHVELAFGDSDQKSTVTTSNGSIHLRARP